MSNTLYENVPAAQLGIRRIEAWQASKAQTNPTLGCRVTLEDGSLGSAFVPTHRSMGRFSMIDLREGAKQCEAPSISWAVDKIREFDTNARGVGTYDIEQRLGGPSNVSLAVSMAMAQAVAAAANKPLWQILDTAHTATMPCPMVTIFSGTQNGNPGIAVQDFLAVPLEAESFAEAVEVIWEVRAAAAKLVAERYGDTPGRLDLNARNLSVGSDTNEEALELFTAAIEKVGVPVGIALHMATDRRRLADDVLPLVENWLDKYPIVSLEDPLSSDDWLGWAELSRNFRELQVVGNELFVCKADRVKYAADTGVANAVLVKPKRIGTLSGAYEALWYAKNVGYRTIISAQSTDSEDSTIADLVVGWNAGQIKIGSIMRAERLAKYNRLLEIEDTYNLAYAGWAPKRSEEGS